MKNYIYLVIVLFSLFIFNVNAEVLSNNDSIYTQIDDSYALPYSKWGNSVSFGIYLYNYELLSKPYTYAIFKVCANSYPTVSVTNGGYNSYFSESNIVVYDEKATCTFSNYTGNWYAIQLQIGKWGDIDDTGEEGVVSSSVHFNYSVSWSPYTQIFNAYLSSDDILTEFVQNSQIDKDLNSILNAQNSTNSKLDSTNSKLDSANSKLDSTNSKLDDIKDMQPDNSDKTDSSKYDNYSSAEDSLLDKAGDADLDSLDIPIDSDTSNFIWDSMTSLLSSHPLVLSTMLAILSVGVIKLILGR